MEQNIVQKNVKMIKRWMKMVNVYNIVMIINKEKYFQMKMEQNVQLHVKMKQYLRVNKEIINVLEKILIIIQIFHHMLGLYQIKQNIKDINTVINVRMNQI